MDKNKGKSVTFRLTENEYQKCIKLALYKGIKENRVVKISEIIREAIKKTNE